MNKKYVALLLASGISVAVSTAHAEPLPAAAAVVQTRINFAMIPVTDLARAESFYTRALGMKVVMRPPEEIALNISGDINSPEPLLFLKLSSTANSQPHEATGIGLHVQDVAAVADQVRASGYAISKATEPRVVSAPNVKPVVTMTKVIVRDPDGNIVELVQLR